MRRLLVLGLLAACDAGQDRVSVRASSLFEQEPLVIPPDHDLEREIFDALDKQRRSKLDAALDAKEPGEQLEHATLTQLSLDLGIFTLDDLFRVGDDLFAYEFRPEQGLGNALAGAPGIGAGPLPPPNLRRVQQGTFGGPDALGCADCHSVGGDDGAGSLTQNAYFRGDGDRTLIADSRNPPAVLGLGPVEALATEMTADLAAQRAAALASAAQAGKPIGIELSTKGIGFGSLRAFPDGSVDTTNVTGVSADLVVRPFGWKGHSATLRSIVKESFRVHMGIVALADQQLIRDGLLSPASFGNGPWFDIDGDGFNIELEDGMVSTAVAYLAQLEVPVIKPPDDPALVDRFARGRIVFDQVQCGSCHVPALTLVDPILVTRPEQTENTLGPPVTIDVARDGLRPKIEPLDLTNTAFHVRLFSDLRRHDMGPDLASIDQPDGNGVIAGSVWLTRPLWGLADTAPYLHDGRAPTVNDAILAHGGAGQASRDLYARLPVDDRRALNVFLLSLQRVRKLEAP